MAGATEATEIGRMTALKGEAADRGAVVEDTRKKPRKLTERKPKLGNVEEGADAETEGEEVAEGEAEADAGAVRLSPPLLKTKQQLKKQRPRRKRRLYLSHRVRPAARLPKSSNLRQKSKQTNLSSQSRR